MISDKKLTIRRTDPQHRKRSGQAANPHLSRTEKQDTTAFHYRLNLLEENVEELKRLLSGADCLAFVDSVSGAYRWKKDLPIQATGGLDGAIKRGEAARRRWIQEGLVVPSEQLARAWGLTRQALHPAEQRGEVVAAKIGNHVYYPRAFMEMNREDVKFICLKLGNINSSEKIMFWLREHGALAGKSVVDAMANGTPRSRVEQLATTWAHERASEAQRAEIA